MRSLLHNLPLGLTPSEIRQGPGGKKRRGPGEEAAPKDS